MRLGCVVGYMLAMRSHEEEESAYRTFVTESLRLAPQGKYIPMPLTEIVRPRQAENVDAEELVNDVISRAGLVVTG